MSMFKKIFFRDKTMTSVDAFETWEVRWVSRHGGYSGDTSPELQVFTNENDANLFADSLRAAFRLIRHTSATNVVVKKSTYIGDAPR